MDVLHEVVFSGQRTSRFSSKRSMNFWWVFCDILGWNRFLTAALKCFYASSSCPEVTDLQEVKYVNVFLSEGDCRRRRKNSPSPPVGREEKHQGGQTAIQSLVLPASEEIGPANCPNPELVLVPPEGGRRKAAPNVKWHLLNTGRAARFHAGPR